MADLLRPIRGVGAVRVQSRITIDRALVGVVQEHRRRCDHAGRSQQGGLILAGPRPSIGSAPSEVRYGDAFTIATPQADTIDRVALIRGNTATHGVNFDQRYVRLAASPSGDGELTSTAPASGSEAPPGWYMLFVVDSGVPSFAGWVHLS
jgi:hypothetical protein